MRKDFRGETLDRPVGDGQNPLGDSKVRWDNIVSKDKAQNAQRILGNKYVCLAVTTCGIETGRGWDHIINSSIPRTKWYQRCEEETHLIKVVSYESKPNIWWDIRCGRLMSYIMFRYKTMATLASVRIKGEDIMIYEEISIFFIPMRSLRIWTKWIWI